MKSITPQELKGWQSTNKDFDLIDVREEWEHNAYNVGGRNIPMGDLMTKKDELPKGRDVVVYCEKGIRSVIAIQRLEAMGFHNLINLEGGMSNWRRQIETKQ